MPWKENIRTAKKVLDSKARAVRYPRRKNFGESKQKRTFTEETKIALQSWWSKVQPYWMLSQKVGYKFNSLLLYLSRIVNFVWALQQFVRLDALFSCLIVQPGACRLLSKKHNGNFSRCGNMLVNVFCSFWHAYKNKWQTFFCNIELLKKNIVSVWLTFLTNTDSKELPNQKACSVL